MGWNPHDILEECENHDHRVYELEVPDANYRWRGQETEKMLSWVRKNHITWRIKGFRNGSFLAQTFHLREEEPTFAQVKPADLGCMGSQWEHCLWVPEVEMGKTTKDGKEVGHFSFWFRNTNPLKGYVEHPKKKKIADIAYRTEPNSGVGTQARPDKMLFLKCLQHKISSYSLLNFFAPV